MVLFLGGVCIVKLFFIQVVHNDMYTDQGEGQYVREAKDIFDRGTIFFEDKDGEYVSAATVVSGFKVVLNPKVLKDKEAAYSALNAITPIDYQEFMEHASRDTSYREIVPRIDEATSKKVTALGIEGLYTTRTKWRSYPGKSIASHTIGFIGYKGDDLLGQYGVERSYDNTLSREDEGVYVNAFAEIFSHLGKYIFSGRGDEGDLVLTIEPTVQGFLEEEIASIEEKWNSDAVGGIIIDPTTGEIRAIAATPGFDPNLYQEIEDQSLFSNPFSERVFELGSVIKPLVMSGAIDSGLITPETQFYDAGQIVVEKSTIYNFDKKGRGQVTMQDVLGQSLNTGMVHIADLLGHEKMRTYLRGFGINQKTGVDLPGEITGLTANLDSPRDIEYATASFGQGIAITPIEAVRAFSALANDGCLVTPHVGKMTISSRDNSTEILKFEDGDCPISKEASDTITNMLVKNIDEYYAEGAEKLEHYSVAGKTGTAQIPNHTDGGYYDDRHLHSFFGYFPASDPEYLVFFFNMNPKQVRYASQTLFPPFMETAKFLTSYYHITPDR